MSEQSAILTISSSESIEQEGPPNEADFDIVPETASTTAPDLLQSQAEKVAEACLLAEAHLRNQFLRNFEQMIHDSEFEFGFSSPADKFVLDALDSYGSFAREWINDLFLNRFDDPFVLSAILRVIAHFDYQQMYPQGITIAVAATVHTDAEVRECGVRCFESWEAPENINILKNLSFPEDWLSEYLADVIAELEEIGKQYGTLR
jgi:hypothetical protein